MKSPRLVNSSFSLVCLFLSVFMASIISQVNDSSPKTVLSQLCELLAARPLQGLVYEEARPPRTAWGPLAPMLEFVSAQTGLPIVAVGGGAGLGRMPQVGGGRLGWGWGSKEHVFAACVCVRCVGEAGRIGGLQGARCPSSLIL